MPVLLLAFMTAFTLAFFAIPAIIQIARTKHLYDEPGERSSHNIRTPSLGGIAIFTGAIFAIVYWTPFRVFGNLQYILCAMTIIFLVGAKDDISPVAPTKKLVAQLMAAAIIAIKSDIRLGSFYGFLGLSADLPYWLSVALTVLTILVITNAFNLIDGINGLAGSIALLIASALGLWFYLAGAMEYAILALALAGAILAFLKYNITPAQIFMGDTGSLIIGLVISILSIRFIELNHGLPADRYYQLPDGAAIATALLIVPLFDTSRVFVTRMLRGQSPFKADRRHIHHLLIDYGFTHGEATLVLVVFNISMVTACLLLNPALDIHQLLLFELSTAALLTLGLHEQVVKKNRAAVLEMEADED
jgi:UDP-N-acetylmuramyl pentapeptide phosphotransferase/UDP-N-acetylglucosamine-1-phosphate transferase